MAKAGTQARPEQHRICNFVPSPEKSNRTDWEFDDALEGGALWTAGQLPPTVDLRQPWWTIGDQGDTGSCVGWASTDGVARYLLVKAGRLDEKTTLSPRFTWMAAKETDEDNEWPTTMIENAGVNPKPALDVLRRFGAVPDTLLPFTISTAMYTGPTKPFYVTAAKYKIGSYFNLKCDLRQWRVWLAENGPILAGVNIDDTWDRATSTGGKLDIFRGDTTRGGHAVTVVGYTEDQRFIVRNSWGTEWGDSGFAYVSEDYIKSAFFNESYGVTL
jgi:C1A family cysteine protease